MSLGDGRPLRKSFNGVGLLRAREQGRHAFVVAAAGHLFSLPEGARTTLPVFDVEWVPSFKVNKSAYFTKKYLDTIQEVGKTCDSS